jgi:hypothetical protein
MLNAHNQNYHWHKITLLGAPPKFDSWVEYKYFHRKKL